MQLTHEYMAMLYDQMAKQHAEIARLQDELRRLVYQQTQQAVTQNGKECHAVVAES